MKWTRRAEIVLAVGVPAVGVLVYLLLLLLRRPSASVEIDGGVVEM